MPTIVIDSKDSRPAEDLWDFLSSDDGVVTNTIRVETQDLIAEGDLCDVYHCTFNGGPAVLKLGRNVIDNDLVSNEADVLSKIYPSEAKDSKFYRYLPRLLYSAQHQGRQVNILPYFEGYVSLAEILRAYPEGISHLDAIWMFRRLLEGIGFVHEQGFVHGALTLDHVLVHPTGHGAKIIDWSYAVKREESHVKAISTTYRGFYPPEVFRKERAKASLDVYMATRCYVALIRGSLTGLDLPNSMPPKLRDYVRTLTYQEWRERPSNAWTVYEELDQLLRETVGPRSYRKFEMPASATG